MASYWPNNNVKLVFKGFYLIVKFYRKNPRLGVEHTVRTGYMKENAAIEQQLCKH